MSVLATTPSPAVSGTSTNSNTSNSPSSTPGIADNFQTFLTLLTTQLKNQNPLDPLDTNQFTAQLVQFAGVEQQLKTNDQLQSIVSLEKSAQGTQALIYVGNTVAIDGSAEQFNGTQATWGLDSPTQANTTITITDASGQTAYSGQFTVNQGNTNFVWDGKGSDGKAWPAGTYKLTATATDSSGQPVAISTEIQGVVDSVDLTASPPLLSIGGQNYTTSQIKRLIRPSSSSSN